jgi:hypothetical protein
MSIKREFLVPTHQKEPILMKIALEMDSAFIKLFMYEDRRADKPSEVVFFGHFKKLNEDLKRDISKFIESYTDGFNTQKITKVISENIRKV